MAPAGYTLIRPIGGGTTGTVFLARQDSLSRLVAVKHVPGAAAVPVVAARVLGEARILAALECPQIVAVLDMVVDDEDMWIVMEHVPGGTLQQVLAAQSPSPAQALTAVDDIAAALEGAHRAGIVHCDLKPANVLITAEGRCQVADFGIARARDEASTRPMAPGAPIGTPLYMSPEQARGSVLTQAADIYALGVIAYEMLVGRPPFAGPDAMAVIDAHANEEPPSPRLLRADFPARVEREIVLALRKRPQDRPASASRFADRLRRAAARAWPGAGETAPLSRFLPPTPSATDVGTATETIAAEVAASTPTVSAHATEHAVRVAPLEESPATPAAGVMRASAPAVASGRTRTRLVGSAIGAALVALAATIVIRAAWPGRSVSPLGLTGVSVTVDGACASGAVALTGHLLITGTTGQVSYQWVVDGARLPTMAAETVDVAPGTAELRVALRYSPSRDRTTNVSLAISAPRPLTSSPVAVAPCPG